MDDKQSDERARVPWRAPKAYGWKPPGTDWHEIGCELVEAGGSPAGSEAAGLREVERRLLALSIEHAPIFIFTLDPRGNFVAAAGGKASAYLDDPGQIVGRPVDVWIRDVPEARLALAKALGGDDAEWHSRVGECSYEVHLSPVLDGEGKLMAVSGVAFDCCGT